jgi:type VI secretion system protein ImpH
MADIDKHPDVIKRLTTEGFFFNFFQALSLIEEKLKKTDNIKEPLETGRIRCIPDTSLAFPASDIKKISEKNGVIELALTFMGLVGVSSPLPIYFSEYVARHEENGRSLIDFLNIFNHRCYILFYRSWKKYRASRALSAGMTDPFVRRIALIAGINPAELSQPSKAKLLTYSGLFTGKSRSKSAMIAMLSDFFDGLPVAISEYMPRWVPMTNLPKMGVDSRLGVNSMLGTLKWDIRGKFRVKIGPLARDRFEQFLPGTENISKMKDLVGGFLFDPLAFDIEVQLQSADLVPVILGQDNTRLGETSSLGESTDRSDVQSVVIE